MVHLKQGWRITDRQGLGTLPSAIAADAAHLTVASRKDGVRATQKQITCARFISTE
jgi:hypothetical protein